jgi:hypothetical protein
MFLFFQLPTTNYQLSTTNMFGPFKKPSRLSQWNGRRRSSRSDDPDLPHLFCRATMLRMAAVLATVLGATYLAHDWGGLMSYRVGEVRAYDLRARVYFKSENAEETARQRDEVVQRLTTDPDWIKKTPEEQQQIIERKRQEVEVVKTYAPGELLVERNFPITDSQYELLQKESHAFLKEQSWAYRTSRTIAVFLVFTLLSLLVDCRCWWSSTSFAFSRDWRPVCTRWSESAPSFCSLW